jgi:hypothetical protein
MGLDLLEEPWEGAVSGVLPMTPGGPAVPPDLSVALAPLGQGEASYHMTLDLERLGPSGCADAIVAVAASLGLARKRKRGLTRSRRTRFAHASEREFAGILDFYGIHYMYEPHTFPLAWDEEGRVTMAFTPDFYLPEYDLYLELTTLKQGLVSKKNRKIRLLGEIYPEVQLKVLYGKDYKRLLERWGFVDEEENQYPK